MKTLYALMLGLGLIFSASGARADAAPVDPTVIINGLDPSCTTSGVTCFSSNSVSNPVAMALDPNGLLSPTIFVYNGTSNLDELFVIFSNPMPFEDFTCQSDIFSSCGFVSTVGTSLSDDVELFFKGGVLTPGEGFTVQVTPTPEPSALILLLTGMLPIMIFGGKRWAANHSA
ncbi:MAG: PEP-CTERM sorting domain-containing protein [Candidatus Acidiferrales bacterium]